ncbi:unnamed protein product [Brachionus calyciflorus]|uniref:Uncharacterized protein n=1 Tax=Brachionus calyciflorus TaxID=104777 RepID=A0A814JTZ6_9BILA|nr:unnamed protein product [Brachionus calyciflorus]
MRKAGQLGTAITDTLQKSSIIQSVELITKMAPLWNTAGVFFPFLSTFANTFCQIDAKFEEVLKKLDKISEQIEDLASLVECTALKSTFREMELKVPILFRLFIDGLSSKISNIFGSPINPTDPKIIKQEIKLLCKDPTQGVRNAIIMFELFVKEETFLSIVKNCAKYNEIQINLWIKLLNSMLIRLNLIAKGCSEAYNITNSINAEEMTNKFAKMIKKYIVLLKKKFNEDEGKDGMRKKIASLAKETNDAEEMRKKLSDSYSFNKWEVIRSKKDMNGVIRGFDRHYSTSIPACYSEGSFYFKSDDENVEHALVTWSKEDSTGFYMGAKYPMIDINTFYQKHLPIHVRNYNMKTIGENVEKIMKPKISPNEINFIFSLESYEACRAPLYPFYVTSGEWGDSGDYVIASCTFIKVRHEKDKCNEDIPFLPEFSFGSIFFSNSDDKVETHLLSDITKNMSIYGERGIEDRKHILSQNNQILNKTDYYGQRGIEDRQSIKKKIENGFTTLIQGQHDIREELQEIDRGARVQRKEIITKLDAGFSQLSQGQIKISEDIIKVGEDVKHYGEQGIRERAEILTDVRKFGEIGIAQRTQIINKLDYVHKDVGDIRQTQLEEANKATVRFDYLKYNLGEIKELQIDEARKSEVRFNIVSGGINDLKHMHTIESTRNDQRFNVLNSGLGEIKNHLSQESKIATERFGVLNNGIDRIQNHLQIESHLNQKRYNYLSTGVNDIRNFQIEESQLSAKRFTFLTQQADINFGIISNGIVDIKKAQDQYNNEIQENQAEIMKQIQQESIIGTERFKVIKSSMTTMINMLHDEGTKSNEILNLIYDEKKKNAERFEWIATSFQQQNKYLASLTDQQNLTIYLLNEISESIEIKAKIISETFQEVIYRISTLDKNINDNAFIITTLLNDIKRMILKKPNTDTIAYLNLIQKYLDKTAEFDILWRYLTNHIKKDSEYSLDDFQNQCIKTNPEELIDFLIKSANLNNILNLNFYSSLKYVSQYSIKNFNKIIQILIKDIHKAILIRYSCLKFAKTSRPEQVLNDFIKSSDISMNKFTKIHLSHKYSIPFELDHSNRLFDTINDLIVSKMRNLYNNNTLICSYLYNYLINNYNWNDWTVFVNDKPKETENQQAFFNKCETCKKESVLSGGGLELTEIFQSNFIKKLTIFWKPATKSSKSKLISDSLWNMIYTNILNEALNKDSKDAIILTNVNKNIIKVLHEAKIPFCSTYSIVHQITLSDQQAFENLNFASRYSMPSIESRLFVFSLKSNITLEIFVDVGSCQQVEIVKKNTNIDQKYDGYSFLLQMVSIEMAINEPQIAGEIISTQLTKYFRNLWTVSILENANFEKIAIDVKSDDTSMIHLC